MFYGETTKLFNYHKIGSFITPDRRQSKTLWASDERGHKSLETVFSIAIVC